MTDFYVSPTGDDANSGRSADASNAFRSLARAQQATRANSGADTVFIREGTYTLNTPLSLTGADSGNSYVAYANEQPIISGQSTVSGWRSGPNGIWTTTVNEADVRQLIVGGVAQTEARFPNYDSSDPGRAGWLRAQTLPGGRKSNREFAYDKSQLSPSQVAPGQKVTVFSELDYSMDALIISSVDTSAGIIRFDQATDFVIGPTSRFFISGAQVHLDQVGEWWFDKASRTLSYKAPAGFDGGDAVVAGGDKTLIRVDGASNVAIQGLNFANVTTTSQSEDIFTAAVAVRNSSGVVVDGNTFTNVIKGVIIDDASHDNTVSANDFTDIGATAVDIGVGTYQNLITNNVISRVGTEFRAAPAITLVESWGNTLSKNLIQDTPRLGISEANYANGQRSGNNTYEYNDILRTGTLTSETAGIYIYHGLDNNAEGSTVRFNRIIDTGGDKTGEGREFSWGILLDDYTSNTEVYGNFVSGTVLGGVILHGGANNLVYNNVLLDSIANGITVQEIEGPTPGHVFRNNVVQVPDQERVVAADPDFVDPASFYDNVYYNPIGLTLQFDDFTFPDWRARGGDRGSDVVTSVGFVNPGAGDYRFAPDSFALSQGIPQIPFDLIGPDRTPRASPAPAPSPTPTPAPSPAPTPAPSPTPTPPPAAAPGGPVVQGTNGNDVLQAAGANLLIGGGGADTFVFAGASASVEIADFEINVDRLQLSRMFFDAASGSVDLAVGRLFDLDEQHFIESLTGQASVPRVAQLIYENDSGRLWWDADGLGGGATAVPIVTLRNAPELGSEHIFLV